MYESTALGGQFLLQVETVRREAEGAGGSWRGHRAPPLEPGAGLQLSPQVLPAELAPGPMKVSYIHCQTFL